jgi:hypothetical protein
MPNLDGVSACHLIRQFDATPIVAMTSNIRSDDISMYFQHGTLKTWICSVSLTLYRHERCAPQAVHERRFAAHVGEASRSSQEAIGANRWNGRTPARSGSSAACTQRRGLARKITRNNKQLELANSDARGLSCGEQRTGRLRPRHARPSTTGRRIRCQPHASKHWL